MPVHITQVPWWRRSRTWVFGALALVLASLGVIWLGDDDGLARLAGPANENGSGAKASAISSARVTGTQGTGTDGLVEVDLLGARMDVSRLFQLGFGGGLNVDSETRAT